MSDGSGGTIESTRERRVGRWAVVGALVILLGLITWAHLVRLNDVPRGLYVDESSIGHNAATIAASGRDEHGERFPIYFRAFGEYKNPVYVYATALVFKLAGISIQALRLTSFLFFLALLAGIWCLARQLFPESPAVAVWAMAGAGFLPWFFTLSRIAVEVISQPAVMVWILCLAWAVYESDRSRSVLALLLGIATGFSLYTYSTARLLTPVFVLTLLVAYAPRRYWRRHLFVLAGAAVAAIPYAVFALQKPGALVKRFRTLTFVFSESLSIREKIGVFCDNYLLYWSPRYLLLEGDPNRRYSTGSAGEVYFVVFALAVAGLVWAARHRAEGPKRFLWLLALNLLAAPVAASLTSGRSALRSNLLGLFLLVFSCFGFALLLRLRDPMKRRAALAAVALILAFEAGRYLRHYFGAYVPVSVWAFSSYDFQGALETAIRQKPSRIIVSRRGNEPQAHLHFYKLLLPPHPEISMEVSRPRAGPGFCVLYFNRNAHLLNPQRYRSRTWGINNPTILRCFEDQEGKDDLNPAAARPLLPGMDGGRGSGGEAGARRGSTHGRARRAARSDGPRARGGARPTEGARAGQSRRGAGRSRGSPGG